MSTEAAFQSYFGPTSARLCQHVITLGVVADWSANDASLVPRPMLTPTRIHPYVNASEVLL